MTQQMTPLDQLKFGHEAEPPINARRTGREVDIEALASSIGAHGLIQALTVREIDGHSYVADGNRRLAALRLRASEGAIAPNEPIKCDFDTLSDGEEISLAANIMRAPLHEADQLETFCDLADNHGMSEFDIAKRFGIEHQRVRKILALGRLHPVILKWWRETEPNQHTAEVVRAFTLAPSLEEQERVFTSLSNTDRLYGHIVRGEFGVGDRQLARLMKFVGVKDYVAAGGQVTENLFSDDHVVSDPSLAAKIAADKLQAKVDDALADGWSWAAQRDALPSNWSWNWQKLPISKKKATKEQKAESGVVVELDYDGNLQVTYGVVKPREARTIKADGPTEAKPAAISTAMLHSLSIQATLAVRSALQAEPRLGLVALLAGFLSERSQYNDQEPPVRVQHDGMGASDLRGKDKFPDAFVRLASMTDQELFAVAAGIAGNAVNMERPYGGVPFNAADYFRRMPKRFVIEAIREAVNEDEARKAEKMKKVELVAFAVENVDPTGWLPPELRTSSYPKADRVSAEEGREAAE